ncbi:hypothetical protein BH24ACT22_BH24ACT22_19360 [soil metagenome]
MGLAVIMVLLVGVMGAGLLVFVRNDLEAVVEVNQGQKAFDMADAGVQVAKRHLSKVDANPENYDTEDSNGESAWSENSGKSLDFDGDGTDDITADIRYLEPSTTDEEAGDEGHAPVVLPTGAANYTGGKNYFRVTARGEEGRAVRQVRAIYVTENLGFPVGYYATQDINFDSDSTMRLNGMSLFAGRCIKNLRDDSLTGEDKAYGNWAEDPDTGTPNIYNGEPRLTKNAGAAASGGSDGPCGSGIDYETGGEENYGTRDFDSASDNKTFQKNTWDDPASQPENVIIYPFETEDPAADAEAIESLRQKAKEQGNYVTNEEEDSVAVTAGTESGQYPPESDLETVYFVEFDGPKGTVNYDVDPQDSTNDDGSVEGTVVVVNGDLRTGSDAEEHRGVFVVRDPEDNDDILMKYSKGDNFRLEGFANVEGDISLGGGEDAVLPDDLKGGVPGLYETDLWSWRECYSLDCK